MRDQWLGTKVHQRRIITTSLHNNYEPQFSDNSGMQDGNRLSQYSNMMSMSANAPSYTPATVSNLGQINEARTTDNLTSDPYVWPS